MSLSASSSCGVSVYVLGRSVRSSSSLQIFSTSLLNLYGFDAYIEASTSSRFSYRSYICGCSEKIPSSGSFYFVIFILYFHIFGLDRISGPKKWFNIWIFRNWYDIEWFLLPPIILLCRNRCLNGLTTHRPRFGRFQTSTYPHSLNNYSR